MTRHTQLTGSFGVPCVPAACREATAGDATAERRSVAGGTSVVES
jgi:hypothetical protein